MENDTPFALGLRMGYFLAGYLSKSVESIPNGEPRLHHDWAADGVHDIPAFIKVFGESLRSIRKV